MSTDFEAGNLLLPEFEVNQANDMAVQICRQRLEEALQRLERLVAPESVARIGHLRRDAAKFAVRISMVGQIKAGKSALTNALIGRSNLLPSDVNPWTSVVTTVHMNTEKPKGKDAVFTFFTRENWQKMIHSGGHIGEMAMRADSDTELVELRQQVDAMKASTEARLGRNFDLLLGNYHSFMGFTPELVQKYVCLGDDPADAQGRYADITKSAELYIDSEDFGLPTSICDTPGVNDPFLLREAVTLENLANTDICVVVLSAHQAFSSVDISLIRILMALKHEQLVLYVNRIDELQDPDRQIKEIDTYIRDLLTEQDLPNDLPIVFGSAAWAEAATEDGVSEEFEHTESALRAFGEARQNRLADETVKNLSQAEAGSTTRAMSKQTDLSGLHELREILREKSSLNVGRPFLEQLREQALDVSEQTHLYLDELDQSHSRVREDLDYNAFLDRLDTVLKAASDDCTEVAKDLTEKVLMMMSGAFREFLSRERNSLKNHLETHRTIADWKPDTDSLRRDLNLAHDEFAGIAPKRVNKVFERIAADVQSIYNLVLDKEDTVFSVRTPTALEPKTPVSLMRTMSIDLDSGWFSNWFNSRFNQETYLKKFEELCRAEMRTTFQEMQETYVVSYDQSLRAKLHLFLSEHMDTLHRLCGLSGERQRAEVRRKLGVDMEIQERKAELETVISDLENLFKRPQAVELSPNQSVA